MDISEAIKLISGGIQAKGPQIWADMGAGTGRFTTALGDILPTSSQVYAVDRDANALKKISWRHNGKTLFRIQGDIEEELDLPVLHGAVLANVMHYVAQPAYVMKQLQSYLREEGVLIVIEYNTTKTNPWVPFPISLDEMKTLAAQIECDVSLLATVPSKFNSGDLYSVLLRSKRWLHGNSTTDHFGINP